MIRAWNRFFFAPVDPLPIALYRIVFGLLVMTTLVGLWPDLSVWFGADGVLPRDSAWLLNQGDRLDLTRWLPVGVTPLRWFFVALFGAALMLSLGLFTRVSAALVFLGLVSLHHRNPLILHSGDTLMRACAFFLIFSQAGRALSLDRLIRLARGREGLVTPFLPPWGQRLIQIQVSVMYVSTVCWKLRGPMWREGTATWFTSQLVDFQRFPVPFLFDHLWTVRLVTWGTLAVELALGTLIWVPRLRYYVLRMGILLHLGLEYSMDIPLFQWITMSTYLCFLAPEDLRAAAVGIRRWAGAMRVSRLPLFSRRSSNDNSVTSRSKRGVRSISPAWLTIHLRQRRDG